jgi:CRISPR-associated protein Cmr1
MHIINAQFETTSPMFIAGYTLDDTHKNTQQPLSIRPTAIKGALRFWWRALTYPAIRAKADTAETALKQLHQQEMALFGAAAAGDKNKTEQNSSGQSLVLLRVKHNVDDSCTVQANDDKTTGEKISNNTGCQYLLGMGLFNFKTGLSRSYITSGSAFSLQLAVKPGASAVQIAQLKQALLAFGLLGSLGSRARKGFGSVQLLSWDEQGEDLKVPNTKQDYISSVDKLFSCGAALTELPPFTAFSAHAMADLSCADTTPVKTINMLGSKQQLYRGYGQNSSGEHRVAGQKALQIFSDDHDDIFNYLNNAGPLLQPKRLVFGLPHNVRFSSGKGNLPMEIDQKNQTRRASPLFIHIHKLDGQFVGVQSLLAAEFFPQGAKVKYGHKSKPAEAVDWSVITNYLTLAEYRGPNHHCDGFTQRQTIFQGSQR